MERRRWITVAWFVAPSALVAGFILAAGPQPVRDVERFVAPAAAAQVPQRDANPKPPDVVQVKVMPHPNDALRLALADAKTLPPELCPYMRYVWVQNGEIEDAKSSSFTVNVTSRSNRIYKPEPLGKDKLILLRVYLKHYAPRYKDTQEWAELWENFQFDPRFSLLITKGTLKAVALKFPDWRGKGWVRKWEHVEMPDFTVRDKDEKVKDAPKKRKVWKQVNKFGEVVVSDLKDIELVRLPGKHLDQAVFDELCALTCSQAPVVTDTYFTYRMLSTIQDKGVYQDIWGGLYYQFAGIRRGAKKGTDEDVLFEQLGVGNVENGITAAKIYNDLPGDLRVAVFRSKVTGSPRRIDFLRTLSGRLDETSGLISVSHDLKNQDIDIDTHPIANLLDFKDAAREVIFERSNGLHGYALFNGEGALQDEVPFDIASDHTIPRPHTRRLQAAIGCISCHEAEGSDGWIPVTNDVNSMIGPNKRLDLFADVSKPGELAQDTVDRIAGLYQGNPEKALRRARDDYASSVLSSTGPWRDGKQGQVNAVQMTGTKTVSIWRGYWYDMVDASRALKEIGIDVGDKDALKVFNSLTPPEVSAAVGIDGVGVVILESPRIAALKGWLNVKTGNYEGGISINRSDFDLEYAFIAERAQRALAKQGAK